MQVLAEMIAERIGARFFYGNIRTNEAVEEPHAKHSYLYSCALESAAASCYEAFVSELLAMEEPNG